MCIIGVKITVNTTMRENDQRVFSAQINPFRYKYIGPVDTEGLVDRDDEQLGERIGSKNGMNLFVSRPDLFRDLGSREDEIEAFDDAVLLPLLNEGKMYLAREVW